MQQTHILDSLIRSSVVNEEDDRLHLAFTLQWSYTTAAGVNGTLIHFAGWCPESEELVLVENAHGPPYDVGTAYLDESHHGREDQDVIQRLQMPFEDNRYELNEVEKADCEDLEAALTGDDPVKDLRTAFEPTPAPLR